MTDLNDPTDVQVQALADAIVKIAVAAGVNLGDNDMTVPEVLQIAEATAEQVTRLHGLPGGGVAPGPVDDWRKHMTEEKAQNLIDHIFDCGDPYEHIALSPECADECADECPRCILLTCIATRGESASSAAIRAVMPTMER